MHLDPLPIVNGEKVFVRSNGGDWIVTWHTGPEPPEGTPHGASAVCVLSDGRIVLISRDGERWGLPGGRPEGSETWEETMRREVHEEACAIVIKCHLLGFSRGRCHSGHQSGTTLVRSLWRADVELEDWMPEHEIPYRSVFPQSQTRDLIVTSHPDGSAPILLRTLDEALNAKPRSATSSPGF